MTPHAPTRRIVHRLLLGAVLAAAAVGTSCGPEDPSGAVSAPGTAGSADTAPSGPVTLASAPNPVRITDEGFEPATIEIAAGETVTWRNEGTLEHWALSRQGDLISSATLRPGSSYAETFTEPGTHRYGCAIHPDMGGTVVVR